MTGLIVRAAQWIEGSNGRHGEEDDFAYRRFFISTITRTVEDENHATVTKQVYPVNTLKHEYDVKDNYFRTMSTYKTCYTTEPGIPGCKTR